ncbi:MAG: pyridoxamine 5'-phosphate oxidase family protein [Anaerolineales bacterium]|nr:pyridoxamine 5'-phosphate oxidase family protein [Chloroflexota bacterium]MBL6983116.1 pyridoxamine 5'-phosphate oxidase family protein [Anaerolineales bacterium]
MSAQLTSNQVWENLEKELFAVLGMVTEKGEARTVGIVYIVHNRKLYISSKTVAWKVRHVQNNPNVSITVPIAKRIPLLPWIKIPAATITFAGKAKILKTENLNDDVLQALFRGFETDTELMANTSVLEIEPQGDFITYGVGIPLMEMRHPEKARGRAPVA